MTTGFNTRVGDGEYCLQFETDNREYYLLMQETARRCVDGKPVTNADRIRAMTDEELADCIYQDVLGVACRIKQERNESCSEYMCRDCLLEWLKQPAEGE